MHTPSTQRSRSGLTMLLSRHSVGTYPEMSSHATCQGTFSYSHLSPLSPPFPPKKNTRSTGRERMIGNSPKLLASEERAAPLEILIIINVCITFPSSFYSIIFSLFPFLCFVSPPCFRLFHLLLLLSAYCTCITISHTSS